MLEYCATIGQLNIKFWSNECCYRCISFYNIAPMRLCAVLCGQLTTHKWPELNRTMKMWVLWAPILFAVNLIFISMREDSFTILFDYYVINKYNIKKRKCRPIRPGKALNVTHPNKVLFTIVISWWWWHRHAHRTQHHRIVVTSHDTRRATARTPISHWHVRCYSFTIIYILSI